MSPERRRIPAGAAPALVTLLFAGFGAWFTLLRLLQHYRFKTSAYDLSIFDYALYYTVRGRFLWTPFLPGSSLLDDHFSPALLVLVPLYLVHDGPVGLLIVQVAAVVASGVPVYLAAYRLLDSRLAACGLLLAYFGNPYLIRGMKYDFHPEMWLPLLFLTGLSLIEIYGRWRAGLAVFAFTLLIKEDVWLYLAALALSYALQRRWRLAAILAGMSGVYAVFLASWGFPAIFHGTQPFALSGWTRYGQHLPDIVRYFLFHPAEALAVWWARPVARVLVSFAFLPLLAPLASLPAVPALFINLSSHSPVQRDLLVYYSAPAVPFLTWGLLRALQRLRAWTGGRMLAVAALITFLMAVNTAYLRRPSWPADYERVQRLLRDIPAEASVAAQSHLVPHLPKRECVFVVGMSWREEPVDYVVLDERRGKWPLDRAAISQLRSRLDQGHSYRKRGADAGVVVFERRAPPDTLVCNWPAGK